MTVPILTDGVVRLRAHRLEDAPRIVEQCLDPESIRWTTVPVPYDEAMAREFVTENLQAWEVEGGNRLWAITDAHDPQDRFLGTIDVRPVGAGIAFIGFGLHPAGRGRHLMAAALRLVTGWWFEQGGVRMYWEANRGNFGSWRVAWACGFTFHATLPQKLDQRGEAHDGWIGSIGRDDDLTKPVAPWNEAPTLSADGVVLRAWRADDTAVAEPHDHPSHYVPGRAIPVPETFAAWLLRRQEQMALGASVNWCIAEASTDEPLGEMLIFVHQGTLRGGDTAELGYFIKPSARGRAVAGRAARLATAYGLGAEGLGLRRLVAETAADNVASNKILESLGFTRWGVEDAATAPDNSIGPAARWELLSPPQR